VTGGHSGCGVVVLAETEDPAVAVDPEPVYRVEDLRDLIATLRV